MAQISILASCEHQLVCPRPEAAPLPFCQKVMKPIRGWLTDGKFLELTWNFTCWFISYIYVSHKQCVLQYWRVLWGVGTEFWREALLPRSTTPWLWGLWTWEEWCHALYEAECQAEDMSLCSGFRSQSSQSPFVHMYLHTARMCLIYIPIMHVPDACWCKKISCVLLRVRIMLFGRPNFNLCVHH